MTQALFNEPLFTRADYELLPEGFPAELVEGQLVREPSPTYGHGRIGARLRSIIERLVGPDRLPLTPSDVAIDDYNVFQPDIVVLDAPVADDTSYVGVPRMAMEILSPATAARDRDVKADRLLAIGVAEVWLVDWQERSIEIRRPDAAPRLFEGAATAVSLALPGLQVVPDELFTPPRDM